MASEYLKFAHLFFAFILISGIFMAQYGTFKARRTEDPAAFGLYLSLGKTGGMLSGMSVIAVGIFGILTAWEQNWPLTGMRWLEISYLITIIGAILPPLTLKRWAQSAGKLMPQAMQQGRVLPEQKEFISSIQYRAVDVFMLGLLFIIVALMVFKPQIGE